MGKVMFNAGHCSAPLRESRLPAEPQTGQGPWLRAFAGAVCLILEG